MKRFRRWLLAFGISLAGIAPLGCSGSPEAEVAVERTSLVGKTVVVKKQKPKQFVMTTDGKFRSHGEFSACSGTVRAEEKFNDEYYCLVHSGRDDYWIKADELVEFDKALAWFDQQLNETPRAFDPYMIRAQVAIETGNPQRALPDLNEAVKIKTNSIQPLALRAMAYEQLGQFAKAQQDHEAILKIEPAQMTAYLGRARCLHELGNSDQALIFLDRAIKGDSKCVAAYLQRAKIWISRKEETAALLDYERAIKADAHSVDAYMQRGAYWLSQKKYEKALADFLVVLNDDQEHPQAMTQTAMLLAANPNLKLRDEKKANLLASKAVELTGRKDAVALDALATANAAAGQFDDAVKNIKQALEDPSYAKLHGDTAKKKLALFSNKMPYTIE